MLNYNPFLNKYFIIIIHIALKNNPSNIEKAAYHRRTCTKKFFDKNIKKYKSVPSMEHINVFHEWDT